ncbi:hypothetical protein IKD98_01185 [Candidatus Saccharibacteria bacterium]|nr:hypothetical protein [Candidatus Saccharibacteria bacterium]
MDNNSGGKKSDGMQFFSAGAGVADENINTNPSEENLDLSNWSPENAKPNAPLTPEIPTNKNQEIGSTALSVPLEPTNNAIEPQENDQHLGEVVELMPPGINTEEQSAPYPDEITKILQDDKLSDKELKSLENKIKEIDPKVLDDMVNEIRENPQKGVLS